jgi:hypothetical protein
MLDTACTAATRDQPSWRPLLTRSLRASRLDCDEQMNVDVIANKDHALHDVQPFDCMILNHATKSRARSTMSTRSTASSACVIRSCVIACAWLWHLICVYPSTIDRDRRDRLT